MPDELKMAQGPAILATPEEIAKETDPGYTKPNLHRRIDNDIGVPITTEACLVVNDDEYLITENDYFIAVNIPDEYADPTYSYQVLVGGVNSFRSTTTILYNEDDNPLEIP